MGSIRPDYYRSPPTLNGQAVLSALGVGPELFEVECIEAWIALNWEFCAPIPHVAKYLWRMGKKSVDAETDSRNALYWLGETLDFFDRNRFSEAEPWATNLDSSMVFRAIAILEDLIKMG